MISRCSLLQIDLKLLKPAETFNNEDTTQMALLILVVFLYELFVL